MISPLDCPTQAVGHNGPLRQAPGECIRKSEAQPMAMICVLMSLQALPDASKQHKQLWFLYGRLQPLECPRHSSLRSSIPLLGGRPHSSAGTATCQQPSPSAHPPAPCHSAPAGRPGRSARWPGRSAGTLTCLRRSASVALCCALEGLDGSLLTLRGDHSDRAVHELILPGTGGAEDQAESSTEHRMA